MSAIGKLFAGNATQIATQPVVYPFYHIPREQIILGIRDPYTSMALPIIVYWVTSLFFHFLDSSGWKYLEKYRIHEPEEVKRKNRVTVPQVIRAVVIQQVIQTALGLAILPDENTDQVMSDPTPHLLRYSQYLSSAAHALGIDNHPALVKFGPHIAHWLYWWGVPIAQFLFATFFLDAWQYFWHRYFHTNLFLYRTVHSWHHRLYCPYAFGALYNHPLEGFILDSCGAGLAHFITHMSTRQAMFFFSITTAKTVDDHCGFSLPWDPFQIFFTNTADYHDIHHQIAGLKKNYSQPYFIHFDVWFNTRMTRAELEAKTKKAKVDKTD